MKEPGSEHHLRADADALSVHDDTDAYCLELNDGISRRPTDFPLGGSALHAISADALAIHRSVFSLCVDGWAFVTPALLRTQLDLILSATVIAHEAEQRDYMGFKYMFSFCRDDYQTGDITSECMGRIDAALAALKEPFRARAAQSLSSAQKQTYWYRPEFRSPADINKRLMSCESKVLYEILSRASHGAFFGLRYLRDTPNDIHPHPRPDRASQSRALLISSRMMLELSRIRGWVESVAPTPAREALLARARAADERVKEEGRKKPSTIPDRDSAI